jgi:hypothetical protein
MIHVNFHTWSPSSSQDRYSMSSLYEMTSLDLSPFLESMNLSHIGFPLMQPSWSSTRFTTHACWCCCCTTLCRTIYRTILIFPPSFTGRAPLSVWCAPPLFTLIAILLHRSPSRVDRPDPIEGWPIANPLYGPLSFCHSFLSCCNTEV